MLNLLDLRSIMGCPGGTRSVFTRAFWAKRELLRIFFGNKEIIITSKHGTTIFFSHNNLFLGKIGPKSARIYTERVYRIVLMPPGHPIILLESNKFIMAAVSVDRSIWSHFYIKSFVPVLAWMARFQNFYTVNLAHSLLYLILGIVCLVELPRFTLAG